jgi:hypothetical protein
VIPAEHVTVGSYVVEIEVGVSTVMRMHRMRSPDFSPRRVVAPGWVCIGTIRPVVQAVETDTSTDRKIPSKQRDSMRLPCKFGAGVAALSHPLYRLITNWPLRTIGPVHSPDHGLLENGADRIG